MTEPTPERDESEDDARPEEPTPGVDPTDTDHPAGEDHAAANRENESPG